MKFVDVNYRLKSATIFGAGTNNCYRTILRRTWGSNGKSCLFAVFAPGRGDQYGDDLQTRRAVSIAHHAGCHEISIINICDWVADRRTALIARDRAGMDLVHPDRPVPAEIASHYDLVVAAWGTNPRVSAGIGRMARATGRELLSAGPVKCVGTGAHGHPVATSSSTQSDAPLIDWHGYNSAA